MSGSPLPQSKFNTANGRHLEHWCDVIIRRWWTNLDKIWQPDAGWNAGDGDIVEIETGSGIPIWRTFVYPKRKYISVANWVIPTKFDFAATEPDTKPEVKQRRCSRHLENRYDIITPLRALVFRWNLVFWQRMKCRRQWYWNWQNNSNMADICVSKLEVVTCGGTIRSLGTVLPCIVTMALSYIIFEIKRDIGRKSQFFSYILAFNAPYRRSPSEYCHTVWYGKTRMVWLLDGQKSSKIYSPFWQNTGV